MEKITKKKKQRYSKFGPMLEERWARIGEVEIQSDSPEPIIFIPITDVTKKDMRQIADELVCTGYGQSAGVQEDGISLYAYDMLLGDPATIKEAVVQLLQDFSYVID